MKTDTFIEIGSQHQICEDYIISGDNYIILADGCSSSDHSEMGARFLCYMTREFMKTYVMESMVQGFTERMGSWIIHNAEVLIRQLGLKKTALDATLIASYVKDDWIHIHMFGDGCVILQTIYGDYEIYSVDFKAGTKSMPYYLRYLIDREGHKIYHDLAVEKTITKTLISKHGEVFKNDPVQNAYDHVESWHLPIEIFKSVSICSDGIETFLLPKPDETGNKIMNVEDMIPSIFDFKSSTGVFLQRQINICKRIMKKNGLSFDHFDDLSIGTFLTEVSSDAKDSNPE